MKDVKGKQHAGLVPVRSGDKAVPSQLPSREGFVPSGGPLRATVAGTVGFPPVLVRLPRTPAARFCRAVRGRQNLVPRFWNPVPARWNAIRAFWGGVRLFWSAVSGFWNEIPAFCDDIRVFWNSLQLPMNLVFNHLHANRRKSAPRSQNERGSFRPLPSFLPHSAFRI